MGKKGHSKEKKKKLTKKELKKLKHEELMNKKGNNSTPDWQENKKAA